MSFGRRRLIRGRSGWGSVFGRRRLVHGRSGDGGVFSRRRLIRGRSGSVLKRHFGFPLLGRRVSKPLHKGGVGQSAAILQRGWEIEHLRTHAIIYGGASRDAAGRRRALGGRTFSCLGFVAFGTHLVIRVVPGWPARSGSVELGTSRVVGKQGERGEAKLSTRQTRLETRWREMKEIEKSETCQKWVVAY